MAGTPIEEWFRLFLRSVNHLEILEHMKQNLNMVVGGGMEHAGPINANLPERYVRRVIRNKRQTKKEFQINAQVVGF